LLLRYKFGPRIDATLSRPAVPGEPVDVEVGVTIAGIQPGPSGTVSVALAVAIPPHDPVKSSALVAVHAIAFGPGDGIPADPQKALAAPNPAGSVDASGQAAGATLPLEIHGVPEGLASIVTVLVFDDAPAAPPAS
jgi:hypothetical protein